MTSNTAAPDDDQAVQAQQDPQSAGARVEEVFGRIARIHQGESSLGTFRTGFRNLDVYGLPAAPALILLAGRPGSGRSTLLHHLLLHQAQAGGDARLYSLDLPAHQVTMRMLTALARVPGDRVRTGRLDEPSFNRLAEAAGAVAELPLSLVDDVDFTVEALVADLSSWAAKLPGQVGEGQTPDVQETVRQEAAAQEAAAEEPHAGTPHAEDDVTARPAPGPLPLLVGIDGIELMGLTPGAEVTAVLIALRRLSRALNAVVVLTLPVGDSVDRRPNHRALASDLSFCPEAFGLADAVLGLYRDEMYNSETDQPGILEVWSMRNRDGRSGAGTGRARLMFTPATMAMADLAPE